MQALTGCYFIFEKMIAENKQNFADFINNHSLNKTELYIRVRLDHIAKCLMKIGDFNVSKMLEKISDENVPASFYETSGLMKFNLQPYKNGNYSKKYSSTDEILLTFIKEIDETVSDDYLKKNAALFAEKVQVFEDPKANRLMLYISLVLLLAFFAFVIYYLTKRKGDSKIRKKDKKKVK